MSEVEKASMLEKISGNLVTDGALTAIGSLASFPLAPLLPVLSNSLANQRHKQRVENTLNEINETLKKHSEELKDLTDSQFKIINEVVLAILHTTEDKKIKYLKAAVRSNAKSEKVPISYASQVSRILRDISADELKFLIDNSNRSRIVFDDDPMNDNELSVPKNSDQGALVSGLISMGLIVPATSTWDDVGRYVFSPIVAKVLDAIRT
jgi:formiminotetrahydrofolate cyclodeaminase